MGANAASRRPFSSRRTLVRTLALGFGVVAGQASGACRVAAFECSSDLECREDGRTGACEAEGFCSFSSDACESGRAYGDRAPSDLAGECVAPEATIESESTTVQATTRSRSRRCPPVLDNICADNRGGVSFELVTACD